MKKLQLQEIYADFKEILSREQLKNVLGGSASFDEICSIRCDSPLYACCNRYTNTCTCRSGGTGIDCTTGGPGFSSCISDGSDGS